MSPHASKTGQLLLEGQTRVNRKLFTFTRGFLASAGFGCSFLYMNKRVTTCDTKITTIQKSSDFYDASFSKNQQVNVCFTPAMLQACKLLAPLQHQVYCYIQAVRTGDRRWLEFTSLASEVVDEDILKRTREDAIKAAEAAGAGAEGAAETKSDSATKEDASSTTDEDVPPMLAGVWEARSYLTIQQSKRTAKWYMDPHTNPTRISTVGKDISTESEYGYPQYSLSFLSTIADKLEETGVVHVQGLVPLDRVRLVRDNFNIGSMMLGPYARMRMQWKLAGKPGDAPINPEAWKPEALVDMENVQDERKTLQTKHKGVHNKLTSQFLREGVENKSSYQGRYVAGSDGNGIVAAGSMGGMAGADMYDGPNGDRAPSTAKAAAWVPESSRNTALSGVEPNLPMVPEEDQFGLTRADRERQQEWERNKGQERRDLSRQVVSEFECRNYSAGYILEYHEEHRVIRRNEEERMLDKMVLTGEVDASSIQREPTGSMLNSTNDGVTSRRGKIGVSPRTLVVSSKNLKTKDDIPVTMNEISFGRRMFSVRNTAFEDAVIPLLSHVTPIVNSYFERKLKNGELELSDDMHAHLSNKEREGLTKGFGAIGSARDQTNSDSTAVAEKRDAKMDYAPSVPYISEMYLCTTDPLAKFQPWHRDNAKPSVSVMIPLTKVPRRAGNTLFFPYTHEKRRADKSGILAEIGRSMGQGEAYAESWSKSDQEMDDDDRDQMIHASFMERMQHRLHPRTIFKGMFTGNLGKALRAGALQVEMNPSDIVIYDSRILKMGDTHQRPNHAILWVLVRYDLPGNVPPGQSWFSQEMTAIYGNGLRLAHVAQKNM